MRRSEGRRRPICTSTTPMWTGDRTWAGWPTRLRERYPGEKVWLVYKGSGVPSYYGIEASDPLAVDPSEVRGLLVVSDSGAAGPPIACRRSFGPASRSTRSATPSRSTAVRSRCVGQRSCPVASKAGPAADAMTR